MGFGERKYNGKVVYFLSFFVGVGHSMPDSVNDISIRQGVVMLYSIFV